MHLKQGRSSPVLYVSRLHSISALSSQTLAPYRMLGGLAGKQSMPDVLSFVVAETDP